MRPIIRVENLGKQYRLGDSKKPYLTLRESIIESLTSPFKKFRKLDEKNTFWALKDINFEIEPGEIVGIIGRNGAGKSTLLKVLSRITEPTKGKVELYGRVASLLEVGTGFHAELTGRENIYLNGSILGMKRFEIQRKFDEIVDFAEIEKFIDTPVKHYSSGMYVRLAFAVASSLEPEILIVDEVLAVGDAQFQKKCLGKIGDVAKGGRTVLFVSHQMGMIAQLCERCILLEKGNLITEGKTNQVINTYLNKQATDYSSYNYDQNKAKDKSAFIVYQKLVNIQGNQINEITNEDPIILETKIRVNKYQEGIEVCFCLQNKMKGRIFTINKPINELLEKDEKEKIIRLEIPSNFITPNIYSWASYILVPGSHFVDILEDECDFLIRDVGSKLARYDGVDYGCVFIDNYKLHLLNG